MYPGVSLWLLLALLATSEGGAEPPWGDWIIVDDSEPGSSVLLRRITPKSVFVAPTFNGCSDGYRQDSLGRCVKVVNVDQQKQWSFFLERLNSMYAVTTNKSPPKEAGPFHINLPLGEGSQEESLVNKRKPPKLPDFADGGRSTTTARPVPAPTRPNAPQFAPTEVQPSTTSDRSFNPQPSSTTERRRETTTDVSFDPESMLGDQPATTEEAMETIPSSKPKNHTANRPENPFVIIVTNEPTRRTEDTTIVPSTGAPQTTEEARGGTSTFQPPSTTEVTDATTETGFPTDSTTRSTEYDESFSEMTDPNVRSDPTTVTPGCDKFSRLKDESIDPSDCEPVETFVVEDERRRPSSASAATAKLPADFGRIRFPTEAVVPVRGEQTFVRFPSLSEPHEDRPSLPHDERLSLPQEDRPSLPPGDRPSLPHNERLSLLHDERLRFPHEDRPSLPHDERLSLPQEDRPSLPPGDRPSLPHNERLRFPHEDRPSLPHEDRPSLPHDERPFLPRDERPSFWWPTWQVGRHPGIRGWPPPEQPPARRPPAPAPASAWADAVPWRRRVFQRD